VTIAYQSSEGVGKRLHNDNILAEEADDFALIMHSFLLKNSA